MIEKTFNLSAKDIVSNVPQIAIKIVMEGSVARQLDGGGLFKFNQDVTEALDIIARELGRTVAFETTTASDDSTSSVVKAPSDVNDVSDSHTAVIEKRLADLLVLIEEFQPAVGSPLGDEIGVLDATRLAVEKFSSDLTKMNDEAFADFGKLSTETAKLYEQVAVGMGTARSELARLADTLALGFGKAAVDLSVATESSTKAFEKARAEMHDLSERVSKEFAASRNEAVALSDVAGMHTSRPLAEVFQLREVVTAMLTAYRSPQEAITIGEQLHVVFTKGIPETLALSEAVAKATSRLLHDTNNTHDVAGLHVQRIVVDVANFNDYVGPVLSQNRYGYSPASFSDAVYAAFGKGLGEVTHGVDSTVMGVAAARSDIALASDAAHTAVDKGASDVAHGADNVQKGIGKSLFDVTTAVDLLSPSLFEGIFKKNLESASTTDALSIMMGSHRLDAATATDVAAKHTGRLLVESASAVDSTQMVTNKATFDEVFPLDESTATFEKGASEQFSANDSGLLSLQAYVAGFYVEHGYFSNPAIF